MKRILSGLADCFVCYVLACIGRLITNFLLFNIYYKYSDEMLPLFIQPFERLYRDNAGIGEFLFRYGLFSKEGLSMFLQIAFILYVVVSELFFRGKTLGKRLMKLEVYSDGKEKTLKWKVCRIALKLICIKFWYLVVFYYMQYLRMPYDRRLRIRVKGEENMNMLF